MEYPIVTALSLFALCVRIGHGLVWGSMLPVGARAEAITRWGLSGPCLAVSGRVGVEAAVRAVRKTGHKRCPTARAMLIRLAVLSLSAWI